jgi:uncharacterized protein (DUF302 family)
MYGYTKKTDLFFEEAIEKTKNELNKEGFGVLTEVDVKATFKKKISVEFDKYTILGACNPPFAYKALKAEKGIGLMLPCNVIVYENDGETFVSSILPKTAMSMIDNKELLIIAEEIENKLVRVIDSI